jgi:formylglycine-generating enzyme required for sulfatase activity
VGVCLLLAAACAGAGCTKPKPSAKVETQQGAREMVIRLRDNVTLKLIRLPAGDFLMGSFDTEAGHSDDEGPVRAVALSKPFYIGVTEITQEQFEAVCEENPSTFKGARNPVEEISWEDAQVFCRELSRLTGKKFRLPTEAEWEYACRSGTRTTYCNGDGAEDLKKVGWFCFDPNVVKAARPVAGLQPNAWGLYDMHGNVWEWCSDWYGEGTYAADESRRDPQGPPGGTERVLRGGSWADEAEDCRAAYRDSQPPAYCDDDIGFRIVCED